MSFGEIAHIYDRFNDNSIYEMWLDFTLNSSNHKPEKLLDLACGTGMMTSILAPFVHEIIGLDIDEKMLAIARKESINQPNLKYVHGDMTLLNFQDETFDMITCYLDSLCFLNSLKEVSLAFKEAYRCLKPGGIYLFDVWTPHQILVGFDHFQFFDEDIEAALLWESFVDAVDLKVDHQLTIFESVGDLYERYEVNLTERTYPLIKYLARLDEAGFSRDNIDIFVDFGSRLYSSEQDSEADRWFFRCYK